VVELDWTGVKSDTTNRGGMEVPTLSVAPREQNTDLFNAL
jgi:hypothetical protein